LPIQPPVNDAILTDQLRKTGNLLDLPNDEAWVREDNAAGGKDPVFGALGYQPKVSVQHRGNLTGYLGIGLAAQKRLHCSKYSAA